MLPPPARKRVRKDMQFGTPTATAYVEAARTKDHLDDVVKESLDEGHPIDMNRAFPEPPNPYQSAGARLKAIGKGDDRVNYVKEYHLKLLHRLLLRNLDINLISQQLDMAPVTILKLRQELNRRLKEEAKSVDTYSFFGKTMSFYDEVRGTALRLATDTKIAGGVRVAALSASVHADQAKLRFLELAGFFDHNRFAPPPAEKADSVEAGRKALGMIFEASMRTLSGNGDVSYALSDSDLGEEALDDGVELL